MIVREYCMRTGSTYSYQVHEDDGGHPVYTYSAQDGPGPCYWVAVYPQDKRRVLVTRAEHQRIQALPAWQEEPAL
jgi:hypothetical protein